jgi:hypothetical protein
MYFWCAKSSFQCEKCFPSPFQANGKAYLKVAEPTEELAVRAYNAPKRHRKAVGYKGEFSLCYMKMTELV